MTRLETGPIWHRVNNHDEGINDLYAVLVELDRIRDTLDALCDEADAEPLPAKGLLAVYTVRAVIRGDQPA